MAKTDWGKLEATFQKDYARTGIKLPDWCAKKGISYASARRYIKVRKNAQSSAESAGGGKTRKTAQKNESGASDGAAGKEKSHPDTDQDNCAETSKSERKTTRGNPNPVCRFEHRNTAAVKHRGYAKYLNAEELLADAADMALVDELVFTRARALSVTTTLNKIMEDMQRAETVEVRLELYGRVMQAEQALDRNIARIESIERSLSTLRIDDCNAPKIVADTRRIEAATLKLQAETDAMTREGDADTTPVSGIVSDIHKLNDNGLI